MRLKLTALLLALLLSALPALAGTEGEPTPDPEELDLIPTTAPAPAPTNVPAPLSPAPLEEGLPIDAACGSVLLAEQESGQVIFQMNPDTPRPVASVTKVMTILLTLEALDAGWLHADDVVTVSKTAAGMGGSQVLLDVAERQTVGTLLKCMIVGSANDAAVALAEAMYGSEAACVDAMNARAAALGMAGTRFVNCTGLPARASRPPPATWPSWPGSCSPTTATSRTRRSGWRTSTTATAVRPSW